MTTWTEQNKTLVGDVDFLFSDGLDFLFSDSSDYVFVEGAVPTWTSASRSQVLLSGWTQVQKISINYAQVAGTLTNFPVYFDLSALGTSFFTHVNADGSDIRVTTSDGFTQVPVEVVAVDTGAETGQIHFLAPTLSDSVATVFYIYYGNAAATMPDAASTYGADAVRAAFLVENGFVNKIPGSIVPQTAGSNYMDGTAGGSASDAGFGWRTANNGTWETYFDTSVKYNSKASLKLSTKAIGSYLQLRSNKAPNYYTTTGFAMLPSTQYKLLYRMKTNLVSGTSNDGARVAVLMSKSDGTSATQAGAGTTSVKVTQDWTYYSVTFTTSADCAFGHVEARVYGHNGTGTLIMDAWFNDIFVGVTSVASTVYNNQNSPATFYTVSDLNWNANIKNSASWTSPAKA